MSFITLEEKTADNHKWLVYNKDRTKSIITRNLFNAPSNYIPYSSKSEWVLKFEGWKVFERNDSFLFFPVETPLYDKAFKTPEDRRPQKYLL